VNEIFIKIFSQLSLILVYSFSLLLALIISGCDGTESGNPTTNHVTTAVIITEPAEDGQIVHPADVHMETAPFSSQDGEITHVCSEWEIWTIEPQERVWSSGCVGGVEKTHIHLGDGMFENSHAGRQSLLFDTDYLLRVRHKNSSGNPDTEFSEWAERRFHTSAATEILPLQLDDIVDTTAPEWIDSAGTDVILPGGINPPALRIESSSSDLVLEFSGLDGKSNLIMNEPPLDEHVPVRVIIQSGDTGQTLVLPESQIAFIDDEGVERSIYLPSVNISPSEQQIFWVSVAGSTYAGNPDQSEPDFTDLVRGSPIPWSVIQPGFKVDLVATDFQLPVDIAFVPDPGSEPDDPFFYVTELYGTIKVVTRDGTVSDYATNLLNFNPTGHFPGTGEQGVTGITVDPQTGDVFASIVYSENPADEGASHFARVLRFKSTDGGRTASSQTITIDMFPDTQGPSHQISNLSIGPDGKLYVHMGDGFYNPSTARNLDSFRGKILRMNLDGSAPEDNPFYDASDGINARDYIYALGFRNPFGGAWSEMDGFLYVVENGPSTDRLARIVRGRDYLWAGDNDDMLNFAIYNWTPSVAPVNIVFIQPGSFNGSGFPLDKFNHAFVSESGPTYATGPQINGKRISEFVIDANGNLLSGPFPLIEYDGSGKATIAGMAVGPDGLYFSGLYKDLDFSSAIDPGASIFRIRYEGVP
jgi:glucose/arabinose dehydrogenase